MSSDSVNCPLGTLKGDKCKTASTDFRVLSNDQSEILLLRSGCDEVVASVCDYHWHKYFRIYTFQQRICMDPFGKHQKKVSKGLRMITLETAKLHRNLNLIPGKKLCSTCRSEVSKHNSVCLLEVELEPSGETSSSEADLTLSDPNDPATPASASMIEQITIPALNEAFDVFGKTPIDPKRLKHPCYGKRKLEELQTGAQETFQLKKMKTVSDEILTQLKGKFSNSSRSDKIQILTLLPKSWSIRQIEKEFNVTNWMARTAKWLQSEVGIMASPNAKAGRKCSDDVIKLVCDFYLSDQVSRVMPGKKDFVYVYCPSQEKRVHIQKQLVLCNLKEAYKHFKAEFPDINIGFSKFAELRPKECVLAGASGTHSVCVCTIHQNVKLMLNAISAQVKYDYHDLLAAMSCNPGQPDCFLGECKNCPGTDHIKQLLEKLDEEGVETVTYKQWTSTDRCDLITVQSDLDEYCDVLCTKLRTLGPHDFIAKQQSKFLSSLKEQLEEGQVILLSDFSENYAFVIQDAAQGYHWTNSQATLHPTVAYYKRNGVIENFSFIIVSDSLVHDTIAVSYFHQIILSVIKTKVELKKVFYFSDGASAQYKNRKNFANLANHKIDYGVPAEWHFFATSHGKGPCDGLGGTLKRLATRASLQRPIDC